MRFELRSLSLKIGVEHRTTEPRMSVAAAVYNVVVYLR